MTTVWNDKNDRDFVVEIIHNIFALIVFQVYLKHLSGHKESIGILGKQIRQWEGSGKSAQTHKHTDIRKLLYGCTYLITDSIPIFRAFPPMSLYV